MIRWLDPDPVNHLFSSSGGPKLGALDINYKAKYDQSLPLPVRLERVRPELPHKEG